MGPGVVIALDAPSRERVDAAITAALSRLEQRSARLGDGAAALGAATRAAAARGLAPSELPSR